MKFIMKTYSQIQEQLSSLVGFPQNLPVLYLLGDTGAGKTCLVRQILGTTAESFPSVKRVRTTVAPTEFIITNEPTFSAAFVFRPDTEISQFIVEIIEQAVTAAFVAKRAGEETPDLVDTLGDSPDQRFRLRCFLSENARNEIAQEISDQIVPKIAVWAKTNFPNDDDNATILKLALEGAFAADIEKIKARVVNTITAQVKAKCGLSAGPVFPSTFTFKEADRTGFIHRLKGFLSVEEGSISPAVAKARVRGKLRSPLLPENMELIVIDGEGIGHDAREARVLSTRHFDYFYSSDAVVLVEDSETPFRAGGKGALSAIVKNGYLPKTSLAFSRLDLVESDTPGRAHQIREVEKGLRNVLHALREDQVNIDRQRLDVRFMSKMHEHQPDEETQKEILSLLEAVRQKHAAAKARFVAPQYDFELLAGFLVRATASLRQAWAGYITGAGSVQPVPWQTQKAFTRRMSWQLDEYRYLKPVAEFADNLVTSLDGFLTHPVGWVEEITESHKLECLNLLTREVSNELINFVRQEVVGGQHPNWVVAADKSGTGSTFERRQIIMDIIQTSAPDLTSEKARVFKNAVKSLIETAIAKASK
jgi:hypothetical protein